MPQCIKITDKRIKAINEFSKCFSEEQFEEICSKANNSSFLIGKNDRNWKADIDFLLRVDKATSILEGKYDTAEKQSGISNLRDMYEREVANEQIRSDKDIDVFSS